MSLSDPIGDMLARIKNSQIRSHKKVQIPSSNFKPLTNKKSKSSTIIDYTISPHKIIRKGDSIFKNENLS